MLFRSTDRPKVWREYVVPGEGDGTAVIRRQAMKVLPPKKWNTEHVDGDGLPACMNAADGRSRIRMAVPSAPEGRLNGTVVLDNGVGIAVIVWREPSQQ